MDVLFEWSKNGTPCLFSRGDEHSQPGCCYSPGLGPLSRCVGSFLATLPETRGYHWAPIPSHRHFRFGGKCPGRYLIKCESVLLTKVFLHQMSSLPPLHSSLLSLLAQVCDAVHDGGGLSSTSTGNLDDYRSFIQVLDWRIRSLPLGEAHNPEPDLDEEALTTQLYQLATLIFLNRNFEDQINKPARTQQHIDKAFNILAKLKSCKQQFPLHIIGCEARTDEQRATVLDLIDSTERLHSSRSLSYTKRIIEACWAQNDLSNGVDTSYSDRLTTILSQCQIVPSFV